MEVNGKDISTDKWDDMSYKMGAVQRLEFQGKQFRTEIVNGKGMDTIFQFFDVRHTDFPQIIAEVVDDFHGRTDGFALDYVPELDSYAFLAKDLRAHPMFSVAFHIEKFLHLLDNTITEIRKHEMEKQNAKINNRAVSI